jgi:hypothetical protein
MNYTILNHRSLLTIEGEDKDSFLQGLITNDIKLLKEENSLYSALLTPQGRFLYDFYLIQKDNKIYLECEKNRCEDLKKRLLLYKLKSKVELRDVTESFSVIAVFGETVSPVLELEEKEGATRDFLEGKLYIDPRYRGIGARGFVPHTTSFDSFFAPHKITRANISAYEDKRLTFGLPEGNQDMIPEKAIPLESGLQDLHAISFNKGCYLGQELTARTHYQGLVRKRLFPAEIIGPQPDSFAPITRDGEEVGSLRSAHNNKAIILLRIESFKDFEITQNPFQCQTAVLKPFKPAWMVLGTN